MFTPKVHNSTVRINPANQNPFIVPQQRGTIFLTTTSFEEAVVVDIILNEEHPEYATDGYNVGVIKFRLINEEWYKDAKDLHQAFPMDSNIVDYPLLNEIVLVQRILNRFYYTTKINVTNLVTYQTLSSVDESIRGKPVNNNGDYYQSQGTSVKLSSTTQQDTLGKYFKNIQTVNRLKHNEGDISIQGRSGHSIRFGTNRKNQAPNILLRVGPNPSSQATVNSQLGLVVEDINKDLSSLWIVSNQLVSIKLSTVGNAVHFKSVTNPPNQFDGNQTIINSDRVLINTKQDRIFLNSFAGIHLTTLEDSTSDSKNYIIYASQDIKQQSDRNMNIVVNNLYDLKIAKDASIKIGGSSSNIAESDYSIVAQRIFIGSKQNTSEPIVLGDQLRTFLIELIDAHLANAGSYVMTPTGAGLLMTPVVSKLQQLKAELEQGKTTRILSLDNFVNRQNERG